MQLELPKATVLYYKNFVSDDLKTKIYNEVSEMFKLESHKRVILPNGDANTINYKLNRKTIVFVDKDIDKTVIPKIWGDEVKIIEFPYYLIELKASIEQQSKFKFNICLANYYSSGKRTIGFHSDNEEKGSTSCIASISIGSERKFQFRNKGEHNHCLEVLLEDASLLIMGDGCQENYEHSVPTDKNCKESRLNLTMRLFSTERYKDH